MPLHGQVTILREERISDQGQLVKLRNDLDTQAWTQSLPPDYTVEMYLKRHNEREFSYQRREGRFVIEYKPTGDFAGFIAYSGYQSRFQASIGIMVDKHFWGTGVAFDAQETLLSFLFRELGVRAVHLWTHSGNAAAVGLAKKSGFKVSARWREAVYKGGQLLDNLYLDLLREEWFALHPEYDDHLPNPFPKTGAEAPAEVKPGEAAQGASPTTPQNTGDEPAAKKP